MADNSDDGSDDEDEEEEDEDDVSAVLRVEIVIMLVREVVLTSFLNGL